MMHKFAIIGAAGYVAPKHMKAIKDNGGEIVAVVDPFDSIGVIDSFSLDTLYFKEMRPFMEYVKGKVDYISICSPNYLHCEHVSRALNAGANVICEKPMVLDPDDIELIRINEERSKRKVFNVLQLRVHPEIIKLKKKYEKLKDEKIVVNLNYFTARGDWYYNSWKGDIEKSGGIVFNIGIHLFDMLLWIFGNLEHVKESFIDSKNSKGTLILEKAIVNWHLSTDKKVFGNIDKNVLRTIQIGNEMIEFSNGFTDLHSKVYRDILSGGGYGVDDVEASIYSVYKLKGRGERRM